MSWLSSKSNSETAAPISSIADWILRGIFPGPLLYPFSSRLRLVYSPNPKHIGVAGDPPLCRACTYLFCQSYKLDVQSDMMALNQERLRRSAELGCYLCTIFYNAECNPYGLWTPDTPLVKRIRDVAAGRMPTSFSIWISRKTEDLVSECFRLNLNISIEKSWLGVEVPLGHLDIWLISFKLVPEKDVEMMSPRMLSASTSPESAAAIGIEWIENCQKNHKSTCRVAESPSWRPTRLIEVCHTGTALKARLCLSSSLPQGIRYVTLSHCWGRLEFFKLLLSNIEELKASIPIQRLTPLFRDALDFTSRIGIKYIWIDSLCIIQDSKGDWASESAMMGDVYENCWCNIAATGFADGHAGLYVQRNPAILYPRKFSIDIRDRNDTGRSLSDHGKYYCMEDVLYSDITLSPLAQRAWVYQERLLSPRIIHFGSCQILWECNQLEACETFPEGVPKPLQKHFKALAHVHSPENIGDRMEMGLVLSVDRLSPPRVDQSVGDVWRSIQYGYNDKNLTFSADKVIALSGLMRKMQRISNDTLIAGLWKSKLLEGLMWYCPYTEGNQIRGKPRPSNYQAPSWSWLSLNVGVSQIYGSLTPLAEIIDYGLSHPPQSLGELSDFYQITGGYIRIRGRLMQASFVATDKELRRAKKDNFKHQELRLDSRSHANLIVPMTLLPDVWDTTAKSGAGASSVRLALGNSFHLLPLVESTRTRIGLILRKTREKGEYQRLGLWLQVYPLMDERLPVIFTAFGAHLPLLGEHDYEDMGDQGKCTLRII